MLVKRQTEFTFFIGIQVQLINGRRVRYKTVTQSLLAKVKENSWVSLFQRIRVLAKWKSKDTGLFVILFDFHLVFMSSE